MWANINIENTQKLQTQEKFAPNNRLFFMYLTRWLWERLGWDKKLEECFLTCAVLEEGSSHHCKKGTKPHLNLFSLRNKILKPLGERMTNWASFLGLKHFPRCRTFRDKTGTVLEKSGGVGHRIGERTPSPVTLKAQETYCCWGQEKMNGEKTKNKQKKPYPWRRTGNHPGLK